MSEQRRTNDPQVEDTPQNPVRGAEEVKQNQPGSKGDGSSSRAGQGNEGDGQDSDEVIVRSRSQKPNANQTATEATMPPGGDLGHKRTTL